MPKNNSLSSNCIERFVQQDAQSFEVTRNYIFLGVFALFPFLPYNDRTAFVSRRRPAKHKGGNIHRALGALSYIKYL